MKRFGPQLKIAMVQLDFPRKVLAEEIDMTQAHISDIINATDRNPREATVKKNLASVARRSSDAAQRLHLFYLLDIADSSSDTPIRLTPAPEPADAPPDHLRRPWPRGTRPQPGHHRPARRRTQPPILPPASRGNTAVNAPPPNSIGSYMPTSAPSSPADSSPYTPSLLTAPSPREKKANKTLAPPSPSSILCDRYFALALLGATVH